MKASRNPSDWVNDTPVDEVEAIYFVAGALSLPIELVEMDMVWRYRWGMEQMRDFTDVQTQTDINDYYRKRSQNWHDKEGPF